LFFELEKNVGLGQALLYGLRFIKTDLVLRMDSDDISSKNRAEILLKAMSTEKVSVVGSYISEFSDSTSDSENIIKYPARPDNKYIFNYTRDPVGHASVLFDKKDVIDAGSYMHCIYFEDTYLWLRMAKRGFEFYNVPESLYFARVDSSFYERRGGYSYLIIEIKAFIKFYRENLISSSSFFLNIITRPFVRILPKKLLSIVYRSLLRS
jgi:UDP-Gal:alpha-D-GlcNAc-diphosphoundecaprenol beta-1,3-galactosyltransferase